MKKFRKTILLITVFVLLLFISYKLFFGTKGNFRAINMVPENAFMIIETDDPFKTWRELEESSIWQHLKTNSFFNEINSQLFSTDSMIRENKILFRLFGSRKILISLHHIPSGSSCHRLLPHIPGHQPGRLQPGHPLYESACVTTLACLTGRKPGRK